MALALSDFVQGVVGAGGILELDLTTQSRIDSAAVSGVTINEQPYRFNFIVKIRTSLWEIGYKWIAQDYSCGGILQTNTMDPVFKADDNGTQTFKLIGRGYGSCTFRIAYVLEAKYNSWADTDDAFLVIEFPINFN